MAKWTSEQQKVIDTRDRNILVSAAAGSGKTAVLVERIIKRITDEKNPIDIDRLLVVTFTNAAAAEMRERVLSAIESELAKNPDNEHLQRQQAFINNANITTIHSFCLGLVKEHFNDVDLDPSVKVADEGEMALLRSDVAKEVLEDFYEEGSEEFHRFVAQFESKNSDAYLESMILSLYKKAMDYPWPEEWLDECVKKYDCNSVSDLSESEYVKLITTYANGLLSEMYEQYGLMLDMCRKGGPDVYEDLLINERQDIKAIIDEEDFDRRKVKLNYKFQTLPRCKADSCDPELKQLVVDYRNEVKDGVKKIKEKLYFQTLNEALSEMKKCKEIIEMHVKLVKAFIIRFNEKKRDRNVIDFNDFEHYAIDILVKKEDGKIIPTAVADELADSFDEVMVDEYQDSNIVQETILKSVSKERMGIYNRFMVGDVKQSIYGFRGAKPDIFIEKYNTYDSKNEDAKNYKIVLDRNFRSRKGVLTTTNFFFRQIMDESLGGINYDEENRLNYGALFKECDNEGYAQRIDDVTELIFVSNTSDMSEYEWNDEDDSSQDDLPTTANELEARIIAARIGEIVNPKTGMVVLDKETSTYRPAKYSDIVILLRSTAGIAEVINNALMSEGIPCYLETKSGYFKTIEIRTILNYLKIIDNPLQDIPLAAVLKSPIAEISDDDLAIIRLNGGTKSSLYENICDYLKEEENKESEPDREDCKMKNEEPEPGIEEWQGKNKESEWYRKDLYERLKAFNDTLNDFRIKITYMSIYDLLCEMLDKTGYYNFIKAMPAGERRKANVDMLKEKAATYEEGSYKGLFNFIRYIEKMNKYEIDMGEASIISENDNAVRIMTIHKSKGLEFPIVFVANMQKKFNMMDSRMKAVIHPDMGIGIEYIDENTRIKTRNIMRAAINTRISLDNIEEEMRLLYVACTRAKEKLILSAGGITDKKLEKMVSKRMKNSEYLGYGVVAKSNSFLDMIAYSLGRNKAFARIYKNILAIDMPMENEQFNVDSNVLVQYLELKHIVEDIIKDKVNEKANAEALLNLPTEHEFSKEIRDELENKVNYRYPYEKEVKSNAKMSVSEIKKISYEAEDDTEAALSTEEIFKSLDEISENRNAVVPEFIEKGSVISGAARGTAYHTVFELFDFNMEPTKENIEEMLENIHKSGRLSKEEKDAINVSDIMEFANSSLGKRMKAAYFRGELYREAQFVMGITETQVEEFKEIARKVREEKVFIKPEEVRITGKSNTSDISVDDTILIQGIIDVYFIEDGEVVIADYKTDRVKKLQELKDHYYVQLELYKQAVEQITGMMVKEKILYSVQLSGEIET